MYTNGSVKLRDLVGLALPGYYNASKIKLYEVDLPENSSPEENSRTSNGNEEQEVNLDLLFSEPLIGSIQMEDAFHQSWASLASDDTSSILSGNSKMTPLIDESDEYQTALEDSLETPEEVQVLLDEIADIVSEKNTATQSSTEQSRNPKNTANTIRKHSEVIQADIID